MEYLLKKYDNKEIIASENVYLQSFAPKNPNFDIYGPMCAPMAYSLWDYFHFADHCTY